MSGFSGGANVIPEITQGMIMEALGWDFSTSPGFREIWIDTENGDDTGGDGSPLSPFKTYARAIQEVPPIVRDNTYIVFTGNSEVNEDIILANRILMAGASIQIVGLSEFGGIEGPAVPVNGDIIISGIITGSKGHGSKVVIAGFKHNGPDSISVYGSSASYITFCERISNNPEPLVYFHNSLGRVSGCNFDNTNYGVMAYWSTVFVGQDNTGSPSIAGVHLEQSILYRVPGTIPGDPEIATVDWYAVFDLLDDSIGNGNGNGNGNGDGNGAD